MSQKEKNSIRSEQSLDHSSDVHITKENVATASNQEPSLHHNAEDIQEKPQVLASTIPISEPLSSEVVGLTRPNHTDK